MCATERLLNRHSGCLFEYLTDYALLHLTVMSSYGEFLGVIKV